jgi:hypothetical protein
MLGGGLSIGIEKKKMERWGGGILKISKKIKAITKTRNLKNTKNFILFFVVSYFRDFVLRNVFLSGLSGWIFRIKC